jgi:hypothetical protein
MASKLNILIIGASGGVARAFLKRIGRDRQSMGRLLLADRHEGVLRDAFIPHKALNYEFIKTSVDARNDLETYRTLLREYSIHLVIDLSVNETRPMLEATDALGISYVNTGIANRPGESFAEVVLDVLRKKDYGWHAPHMLCAGMNPGIVNAWVRQGIERFGVPRGIVHFEYDTGQPLKEWLPLITWSRETFLDEIVNDPAGFMEGKDRLKFLYPNPLKHRVLMNEILSAVVPLEQYPRGFLLLHEENITIAQRYDIPSRFVFAIDSRTMDYLETMYDRDGSVPLEAIWLGDNREIALKGSATVGVRLEYKDRQVYFLNRTQHGQIPGSSGSCWQVAAGLQVALQTLLQESLSDGIYFMEDLYGASWEKRVEENLPKEELILEGSSMILA